MKTKERLERTCLHCGKVNLVSPCYSELKYCDKVCHGKSRRGKSISVIHRLNIGLGQRGMVKKKHPPRTQIQRDNYSKARLRFLETNPGKYIDTIPEILVKPFLDELAIKYDHPKRISRYSVDFFISETNIIIEVDGCYYHACETHRPNGVYEDGKDKRLKDSIREQELTKMGYRVIRIWEHDIKGSETFKRILTGEL